VVVIFHNQEHTYDLPKNIGYNEVKHIWGYGPIGVTAISLYITVLHTAGNVPSPDKG